ncbi:Low temperature viability protein-domain-containing protein [Gamsiella multidivaricata]|uniref:Low temperature viability protein-domain-containing protein n=1 Tax=Gamsiella multidivaricata TaxID=101098 RepID=UPI00221EF7A6|nr:Low temperature viability protein-domain-containing protein [Gamsiella multidivaricata]KAI7817026.1 Low temperature viability protein-domain-containing protein [Gamsiella multidivaricata]
MGKKQFIDRKNARHFHLVHRSQRDPLSRDESAPQRVLKEVIPANLIGKVNIPREEHDDFSDDDQDIFGGRGDDDGVNYGTYDRANEEVELLEAPTLTAAKKKKSTTGKNEEKIGEAALLGLVGDDFNDGSYDYTQHMREIGKTSDAVFMAAPKVAAQQKKAAQSRGIQFTDVDAAQEMATVEQSQTSTSKSANKKALNLPSEVLPSREELDFADVYQSAVPMGLQPDMPFDIRETLEALEDEAFVDGELDESFFDQLDEDGNDFDFGDGEGDEYNDEDEEEEGADGWEADFKKFKKAQKYASDNESFEGSDDGYSQTSRSSRRPAGASASTFSMSSSAMFRNENLTLLDERFDKIEREYEEDSSDEDDEDEPRDFKAEELRKDFDSILDDFLDKFEIVGSKMVPRLEGATSENKLSTIRNALLVDEGEEEKSVATTVGGTRRPKKNLDEDMATELQTDFRSRAERMRDNWDVQTILSTYSNLENHPGMIKEQHRRRIQIDPKTGMPIVTEKLSKKALQRRKEVAEAEAAARAAENGEQNSDDEEESEEEEEEEPENLGTKRNKAETKEEKKARKEAIKQEKRERRETKKATKAAFANEKTRQEKVMKNLKKGQGVTHLD